MPRQLFDRQLDALQSDLVRLSEMVCHAINESITALKNQDLELARTLIAEDRQINALRFKVDETCLQLLATQQPAARDLRRIIAAMNVVLDLERMGDHAANIAKIVLRMRDEPLLKPLIDTPKMADLCCDMLRRSLEAYQAVDAEAARQIMQEDERVDQLYDQIFRELLTYMLEDDRTVKRAMHLLFVAHNLERIADRVGNICERVVYLKTGEMKELKSSLD
jgi:phosphate transport system protein